MYAKLKYIYNMWFGPLTTFEGDTIAVLMHFSTLLIRNRLQRLICRLSSLVIGFSLIHFLCYVVFSRPSRMEVMGFMATQLNTLHFYISYCIILRYKGTYLEVIDALLKVSKPIATGSDELVTIIKKDSEFVVKLVFLFLSAVAVNTSLFFPWTGDEDTVLFLLNRIHLYFGESSFRSLLAIVVYIFFYHVSFTATIPMIATMYFMLHIKFQLALLIENVERLNLLAHENVPELKIYDVNFQRKIKRRLVSCIRHHQGIKTFKEKLNDEIIYWPTFILAASVVVVETSLIIFYLSKINPSSNYRMIYTWFLMTLGHTVFAMVGQTIVDESERLYIALKCSNWYNFDKNNCRLLTIFLIQTQEPMRITSSGIIGVNKELILKKILIKTPSLALGSSRKAKPKPIMCERLRYIYNEWFGPLVTFEGDTIAALMHISTLMGRNRLQRRICLLFSVFAGVCVLDSLCYIIYARPSQREIIGFLTLQLAALHYCVAYFFVQKYTRTYSEVMESFLKNCKMISTGGEKIAGIIKKESKVTIRLVFVFLAVLAVNITLFLPWTGDEDKINFAVYRIKKYFGGSLFGILLQILLYFFCYHGAYVASIPMFSISYYMLHIKFQFVLLTEKVEKLNLLGSKNSSDLIIYDVNFQKKVKRRLVSCIRHHQGIKRFKQKLDKIVYWPTFMLASSVVLFETSLIIFYLSNIYPSSNYRMIFTWSVTTLGHTVYAMVGQTIVDESEKLYTAVKCSNWYKWDKKNCCLLTMFLTNTQEPMQITSSGIIVVSKELILKSYKVLYSLITFYKSMWTKND